jgi:undecaprenyl diphosphate synthase
MTPNKTPTCIGIIIDGNRRWATERGCSTYEGHREGSERIKDVVLWAKEAGVAHLIIYTFSTENWKRSEEEKKYLFEILESAIDTYVQELAPHGVKIRCIGQRERFSKTFQEKIHNAEVLTQQHTACTITFALSYGGRAEITSAVNTLRAADKKEVTEEDITKAMWTSGIPDPDIIIRTGGEKRLSGFLPWQSVYAELFFVDEYWPAFSKETFTAILSEYGNRERRRGA